MGAAGGVADSMTRMPNMRHTGAVSHGNSTSAPYTQSLFRASKVGVYSAETSLHAGENLSFINLLHTAGVLQPLCKQLIGVSRTSY